MCERPCAFRERESLALSSGLKAVQFSQTHSNLHKKGFYKSQCCVLLKSSHLSFYCCIVALYSDKHGHCPTCQCVCVDLEWSGALHNRVVENRRRLTGGAGGVGDGYN